MADARIPERYLTDRQILRLTDAERSSFFMALTWSVSNRTDGRLERADLSIIPTFAPSAIPALVRSNLWAPSGADAWTIVDFERSQTTRAEFEVLDNVRRRGREKKQRQRSKSVPGDSTGGTSPGTTQARQGKARQEPGQDYSEANLNEQTGEVGWWTAPIPDDEWTSPGAPGLVISNATNERS